MLSIIKKYLLPVLFFLYVSLQPAYSQVSDTSIYLITCGPGTETYSIYGHSALRVLINRSDTIYNWGVFDFSTPNFAWKFAKGRLDYLLDLESFERFLQSYFYEKRYVLSQKINLDPVETKQLLLLINENLKPENLKYRYDFFYDDCSTRIRDLIEKSTGDKLVYPSAEETGSPTFREMVGRYQKPYSWLQFGIDLIMGSPGDKKADFRDRMFLPIPLKDGLSAAAINRSGQMIPLLQVPDVILDFETPSVKPDFFLTPFFIFGALMLLILLLSLFLNGKTFNDLTDILLYSIFSILSVFMIFFNFFTDHQQMRLNFNMIWLNPFLIICLFSILFNWSGKFWFRILFFISAAFIVASLFLPQAFNIAIYPLVLIILMRSFLRAEFKLNNITGK